MLLAELQPQYPVLYSLAGFRFCDILLGDAERAARRWLLASGCDKMATPELADVETCTVVAERAKQALRLAQDGGGPLSTLGLDHLTLARAALYEAILVVPHLPANM